MKNFAISLVALVAMTSVSFAGRNRNNEPETQVGRYPAHINANGAFGNGLLIFVQPALNADRPLTNFELMKRNQEKNALVDR
jgi:hypothetical protein